MFPHEENPVEFHELSPEEQLNRAKEFSFTTTQNFNFIVKRADGPFVWDAQGRRYVDFHCGAGSTNFGHNPAFVREAIYDQFGRELVDMPDQDYPLDITTEAKELLCKIAPGDFPKKVRSESVV